MGFKERQAFKHRPCMIKKDESQRQSECVGDSGSSKLLSACKDLMELGRYLLCTKDWDSRAPEEVEYLSCWLCEENLFRACGPEGRFCLLVRVDQARVQGSLHEVRKSLHLRTTLRAASHKAIEARSQKSLVPCVQLILLRRWSLLAFGWRRI